MTHQIAARPAVSGIDGPVQLLVGQLRQGFVRPPGVPFVFEE